MLSFDKLSVRSRVIPVIPGITKYTVPGIRVLLAHDPDNFGEAIGAGVNLIASYSLWLDAILVTDNTREFQRVPDFKIENWK